MRTVIGRFVLITLACFVIVLPLITRTAMALSWTSLEPGMDMVTVPFDTDEGRPASVSLVKVDPNVLDIDLLVASELGGDAMTPKAWGDTYGALLVINASMYQRDYLSSTGYLRRRGHINNPHWQKNYAAFLVIGSDDPSLPPVAILDRTADAWVDLEKRYQTVVQNHRMINADRIPLWTSHKRRHAIAALGQDNSGRLLFVMTPDAVLPQELIRVLLDLLIDLKRLMYLEGSNPAGMYVNTHAFNHVWVGRSDSFKIGDVAVPVPNVIVVRPKALTR